jgi:glucose/arabinose dehydrogenase
MELSMLSPTARTALATLAALAVLGLSHPVPAYEAVSMASGLTDALFATCPPGDTERLFVVQQTGEILIFDLASRTVLATPFLDISALVVDGGEQGLLGLAFHPDYAVNGYFYVYHSADGTICDNSSRCGVLARYSVTTGDANLANPASRFELLEVTQPQSNHNGGMIAFGPDGYLYTAQGDGGTGGANGQNLDTPLGKLLRLDVGNGVGPYTIPASNPFVGVAGLDEIWAYGLRNPWRFSFDRSTGDLWVADVGQGSWEEVNRQFASSAGGENYGWSTMEGTHCWSPPSGCDQTGLVLPVTEYDHNAGDCSISGGYVYRGSVPELAGKYLYGDYCTGRVWAYDPGTDLSTIILTDQDLGNILGFGEDAAGEVYIATGSTLWRLEPGDGTSVDLLPAGLRLGLATPNPFNERSRLALSLDGSRQRLEVAIFAIDGRRERTLHSGPAAGGELALVWDGRDDGGRALPTGVYLLRAETETERVGQRLTLIR